MLAWRRMAGRAGRRLSSWAQRSIVMAEVDHSRGDATAARKGVSLWQAGSELKAASVSLSP